MFKKPETAKRKTPPTTREGPPGGETCDPGSDRFKTAVQQGMTAFMRAKGVHTLTVDLGALTDKILHAEWLVSQDSQLPLTPNVGSAQLEPRCSPARELPADKEDDTDDDSTNRGNTAATPIRSVKPAGRQRFRKRRSS